MKCEVPSASADPGRGFQAQANAGFVTFCEWMGYLPDEIKGVREDLGGWQGPTFTIELNSRSRGGRRRVCEAGDADPDANTKSTVQRAPTTAP